MSLLLLLVSRLALATTPAPADQGPVFYRTRAELGPVARLLPKEIDLGKVDLLALAPPRLDKVKGVSLVRLPGPEGAGSVLHYGELPPPAPRRAPSIQIAVGAEHVELVQVFDHNNDPCCMGVQPPDDHPCGRHGGLLAEDPAPFDPDLHLTLYVLPEGAPALVIHRQEQIPCMRP